MQRFFFDVQNGQFSRDEDGTELPDFHAARLQAADMAGRLLTDAAFRFWDHGELTLIVRDGDDLVLFTLSMVGTTAPAESQKSPLVS